MGLGDGFYRIKRLPPYVFAQVQALKLEARQRGEDIIDFGMGNPDQPTPTHIVEKMIEAVRKGRIIVTLHHVGSPSFGTPFAGGTSGTIMSISTRRPKRSSRSDQRKASRTSLWPSSVPATWS